jgi:diacylglycerol kinase family enzyme
VIIANRGAGTFSHARLETVCKLLSSAGLEVEQQLCSDFAEMTETANRNSRRSESPLIIAAGGDGTINAVFNGLAGNHATCAILPLGTANVLALELGLESPESAVGKIINNESRFFTAGVIKTNRKQSRFFLMAGIGFDGAVVRGVTPAMKKRCGKGAYLISALGRIAKWDPSELLVATESRQFSCHTLVVCNIANYGGRYTLAPNASIFAPSLELVAVTNGSRRGIAMLAAEMFTNRLNGSVTRFSTTSLTITGTKPVQVDGDDWGDAPVEISTESNFARIIV